MLTWIANRLLRNRAVKQIPLVKLLAVVQLGLLARRHVLRLTPVERRRLLELARQGRGLTDAERAERRELTGRLGTRAFAGAAVNSISPVPLPKRLTSGPRDKR